jgi:four helix bundle protein
MKKVTRTEDMEVFKRAHSLTLKLYTCTRKFPVDEKYGLVSQMRRAASSICANLMEGSHRLNRKEFRQFVGISKGSAGELKYHLLLATDLDYLSENEYAFLVQEAEEISRMLNGLANSLTDTTH